MASSSNHALQASAKFLTSHRPRAFYKFGFLRIIGVTLLCAVFFYASAARSADKPQPAVNTQEQTEVQANPPLADGEGKNESDEAAEQEEEEIVPIQDKAWEAMWSGQVQMINEMRETALKLSDTFSEQTQNLSQELQPFEEEARRLLVFANTFHGHPNAMEAVSRRMSATIAHLDEVLNPVVLARSEAEGLLTRVNQMAQSLPKDVDKEKLSEAMKGYTNDITRTRLRLMAVMAQYDSLLPSLRLVKTLEQSRQEIVASLPNLWKSYYLQKPLPWLSPDSWLSTNREMYYSWQAMILRLPVEIPGSSAQWATAFLRFLIGISFAGILSLIIKRRVLNSNAPKALNHIFKTGVPWLVLGFAILGSALSASGDFFRLFIALGCTCIVLSQVYVAWDLRKLQYPDLAIHTSPFFRLLPMAFIAYALLYLPLTQPIALILWVLALTGFLYIRRGGKRPRAGLPTFETGTLECESIINWLCLFLALSGLAIYSMVLYLAYIALMLAIELAIAGMAIVGRINEHLPQEGARAALSRLLVAMAAPFVLVLAVILICIWIAMLPGGTYLLAEYALKGVTVGATQFNIVQLLLIVSAFYLTRTIVSMGTRFLAQLPEKGANFDTTLITPLQTFFTYAIWAIFGLFVLRSLGMELSNLAMVAGGLSVGIGFGMQTIVNNFLSGLILIFGRTLQVGDVIEVGNLTGRVRKISVRATMVETYDNAVIYVPNSEFISGRLINWTSFSRSVRRQVNVGVAYGSDTEKVIKLLIGVASDHKNILKFPAPSVQFADFGASTLDFVLRFWVKDYELGTSTMSDIRLKINQVFNAENIEIAFPQLDVHLKEEQQPKPDRPKSTPNKPKILPRRPTGKVLPKTANRAIVPAKPNVA